MMEKAEWTGFRKLQRFIGPLVWSGGMAVAAFVATTMGILVAHAFHVRLIREPIAWLEAHPGAASWVQGVGSVLAILVAIAVAWWQKAEERRDRYEVALAIGAVVAARIYPRIVASRHVADGLVAKLSEFRKGNASHKVLPHEWCFHFDQVLPVDESQLLELAKVNPTDAVLVAKAYGNLVLAEELLRLLEKFDPTSRDYSENVDVVVENCVMAARFMRKADRGLRMLARD